MCWVVDVVCGWITLIAGVFAVYTRMFIATKKRKKSLFHFVLELSPGFNMICHWADSGDGLSKIM